MIDIHIYMRNVQTQLNEAEYQNFRSQCDTLGESEYAFVKRAVFERMIRNGSTLAKIQRWLIGDHPILPDKKASTS